MKSSLQWCLQLVKDNLSVQYSLCVLGGIAAVLQYASRDLYAYEVRLEVGYLVKQICFNSRHTQQMFVACNGVAALVDMLNEDYASGRHLTFIAIDCIKCLLDNHSLLSSVRLTRFSSCFLIKLFLGYDGQAPAVPHDGVAQRCCLFGQAGSLAHVRQDAERRHLRGPRRRPPHHLCSPA